MKNAICSWLLVVACAAFAADDYPAKPIQMIVPFPAGGPADIVGRLYAQHLAAIVGQPVVTLNRDGASGSIGTPVKTPEAVQARLRAATAKILADPDYAARLATMAVEPMVMTPEQASAFVAAEVRKWKTVAAAAKIQVD